MRFNDALLYSFGQIHDRVRRAVDGTDAEGLAWRPDAEANSIAWLVWHLARVADSHVAEIAGVDQRWNAGWAQRFGLPDDYDDTGYGHSPEQVRAIRPDGPQPLTEYVDAVWAMVTDYLEAADADDFDRIIDRRYDPPVTVGIRLMSVIGDGLQHLGQASYLRGMVDRRQ